MESLRLSAEEGDVSKNDRVLGEKKCYFAIPHEENAPIAAPLAWWLIQLPYSFRYGHLFIDTHPGGDYKVSSARNAITRRFLAKKDPHVFDWLWMADSDMHPWVQGLRPAPDGVQHVVAAMERDDVDVLTGFFLRMGELGPVPSVASRHGRDDVVRNVFSRPPGLHEVHGLTSGGACLAAKRHVFERMLEKRVLWFRDEWEDEDPENWGALKTSEDTWFFYQAQELGFRIWIDTRLAWGHIKPMDMRDELRRSRDLIGRVTAGAAR